MSNKWLDPALLLLTALTLLAGGIAQVAQKPDWAAMCWLSGSLVMAVVLLVEIVRRLARREAGVDLIALLSIGAALVFEQMLVAAVIALMLASGRTLEFFTAQRADRELRALVDRAPRFAWLQEPNDLRQIPVEQIQPGQTLLVRLGEVVPVDGRLLSPRQRWTSRRSAVSRCRSPAGKAMCCAVVSPMPARRSSCWRRRRRRRVLTPVSCGWPRRHGDRARLSCVWPTVTPCSSFR
jgi:hypothetical protein